jgi:hypothetical protein
VPVSDQGGLLAIFSYYRTYKIEREVLAVNIKKESDRRLAL